MLIALFVGVWVMIDATRRGKGGFSAFVWGFATFFLLCLFLPVWLFTRPPLLEPGASRLDDSFRSGAFFCPNCREQTDRRKAYCEHCGRAIWDKMS